MNKTGMGASVKRVEDFRFLTGRGTYTDDLQQPNQAIAYLLRSPHANARIRSIDVAAAKLALGVVAVFTGHDLQSGSIPCGWLVNNKDGSPMAEPHHPPLAKDQVCHVGDQVAVVIAETRQQAKDAAELIVVDYDVQPAVINMEEAIKGGACVHEDVPNNTCFDWELCLADGGTATVDNAIAQAAHQVSLRLVNNRMIPNALEPRAAIGCYEEATGDYTLYTTSQNPHVIRLLMGGVLGIAEHKLRVVAPDVGGGFGSKIYHYAEEAIVTWAAEKVRRPVKWTAERSEAFVSDAHGRDHVTNVTLALDENHRFVALKVNTLANVGAYLSTFASCVPTYLYATLLAGVYTTPLISANVRTVFTNTVPVDAYRGAGRPEATYLLERIVDHAARELGVDRVELRRKNFIPTESFPYQTPVALQYDTGNYHATLDKALTMANWDGFASRREESKKNGQLRGIGLSTYVEACGIAPSQVVGSLGARAGLFEAATIRVNPTGSVSVFTGSHSHGQGHETTFAQVVSDILGLPMDSIAIVHGDTAKIPFGMGTYGSRSLAVGGEAIVRALNKVIEKSKKIAAHLMEVDVADVDFEHGTFTVRGTDKTKTFADIALTAYVPHNFPHKQSHDDKEGLEPGLEEQAFYDPINFTYPAGCHICEVEVDPDTGKVTVVAMTTVDDVGRVINPMIVDGQVHGGLAQGIGQALLEQAVYDDNGQLLTGSMMDYTMPRAADLPSFQTATMETLCAHNSLGVKGVGETGAIGSPPAVLNAVLDALAERDVKHLDMPATPYRVWCAMNSLRPTT